MLWSHMQISLKIDGYAVFKQPDLSLQGTRASKGKWFDNLATWLSHTSNKAAILVVGLMVLFERIWI